MHFSQSINMNITPLKYQHILSEFSSKHVFCKEISFDFDSLIEKHRDDAKENLERFSDRMK